MHMTNGPSECHKALITLASINLPTKYTMCVSKYALSVDFVQSHLVSSSRKISIDSVVYKVEEEGREGRKHGEHMEVSLQLTSGQQTLSQT